MSEESQVGFNANLAEHMDESELSLLSSDLIAAYDEDRASRSEWEEAYIDGLDLLGVKIEDRSTPFEGATGVSHPILSEAVIRFVSQAMMEIFPPNGPVRTTVIGTKSKEKEEQARRVQDYMNYLLTEEIEEYRPSTEQLLFKTALAGSGFRKVYYDQQTKDQIVSLFRQRTLLLVTKQQTLSRHLDTHMLCERVKTLFAGCS